LTVSRPQKKSSPNDSRSLIFVIILVILDYVWLSYSMNILHAPLIAMAVTYPVFCYGGGRLIDYFIRRERPEIIRYSGTSRNALRFTIGLAILGGILLWLGVLLVRPGMIDPDGITGALSAAGMSARKFWLTGMVVILFNAYFEEYLWRFGIFRWLEGRVSHIAAMHISALLFAAYHPLVVLQFFPIAWLLLVFVLVYLGGVAFAWLYSRTRNLLHPIVVHLFVNLNLMLIARLYAH
jgi:membrane protease YdiL (CAAX protease family)